MEQYVQEWLSLLLRWLHFVAGAAWIGTSFYFNWLNHTLRPPQEGKPGVSGELWAIHGGGFYHVQKYGVAPAKLPETLHWFKWEAYTTWLSGVALLCVVYYWGQRVPMLQPEWASLGQLGAVGLGLGSLTLGWLFYHALCRSPLRKRDDLIFLSVFAFVLALAYGLSQIFTGRVAYIHVGATLGTIMALNVFFVIIPGQRAMVEAMTQGRAPDPEQGKAGGQRSLHNNYFTLPVLFMMVSNHYPHTFAHAYNWQILIGMTLIGAGTRHYFNTKHQGRHQVWILPVAALAMLALAFVVRPVEPEPVPAASLPPDLQAPPGGLSPRALAGKQVFMQTAVPQCIVCHTLADAGSTGAVGPNLDVLQPSVAQVLQAVKAGKGAMPSQVQHLAPQQQEAVAQYVYEASRGGREKP